MKSLRDMVVDVITLSSETVRDASQKVPLIQ